VLLLNVIENVRSLL